MLTGDPRRICFGSKPKVLFYLGLADWSIAHLARWSPRRNTIPNPKPIPRGGSGEVGEGPAPLLPRGSHGSRLWSVQPASHICRSREAAAEQVPHARSPASAGYAGIRDLSRGGFKPM